MARQKKNQNEEVEDVAINGAAPEVENDATEEVQVDNEQEQTTEEQPEDKNDEQPAKEETEEKAVESAINGAAPEVNSQVQKLLRIFNGYDELYITKDGGVFPRGQKPSFVKDAVLYKNPFFKSK